MLQRRFQLRWAKLCPGGAGNLSRKPTGGKPLVCARWKKTTVGSQCQQGDAHIAQTSPEQKHPQAVVHSDSEWEVLSQMSSLGSVALRASKVYGLAAVVYGDYRLTRIRAQWAKRWLGLSPGEDSDDDPRIADYWNRAHERNAQRLLGGITAFRGLWVKVGQFLSSRPDIMPLPYLRELKKLQDSVPSRPWEEVCMTLVEELGSNWKDRFQWVDENPLSTASIAQVHLAKLLTGEEVVIKVEHRNIADLILSDLENLRILCNLIARQEPDYDFTQIVQEWIPAVKQELDLCIEAQNLSEAKANMEKSGVKVIVPAPVDDYVTSRVLVMEYCPGFSVRDLEEMNKRCVDRETVLSRVCEAWAVQMHINGFYNADPHPGNILISTSKQQNGGDPSVPVLLDFGLTKRFPEDMKVAFSKMVHSTYIMDVDGLLGSFSEMGLKIKLEDPFEDLNTMRRVFRTVPASKAKAARVERRKEEKLKEKEVARVKRPIEAWPGDLVFFFRVTGLLRGLCSALEMEFPYLKTMAQSAAHTVKACVPAEEHAKGVVYFQENTSAIVSGLQSKMEDLIKELHEQDEVLGIQAVVVKGGETLVDLSAGQLSAVNPRPVTPSTLFNTFSVTKAFAATAVHILAEQKWLDYDDPVSKYWPEFGCKGKKDCTIRQALKHEAGLADALPENAQLVELLQWDNMVDFVANAEPSHKPGERFEYHYITYCWLLGGIVKGASGKSISEIMHEQIVQPLGLQGQLYLGGIPDGIAENQLAVLQLGLSQTAPNDAIIGGAKVSNSSKETDREAGPFNPNGQVEQKNGDSQKPKWERFKGQEQMLNPTTFNMKRVRSACMPSANGHMSARALAKFYSSLSPHAVGNGRSPILSASTVAACVSDAENEGSKTQKSDTETDSTILQATPGAKNGLGFQTFQFSKSTGDTVVGIGHSGMGGSLGFVIPDEDLAVGITVSHLSFSRLATKRIVQLICSELALTPPEVMVG